MLPLDWTIVGGLLLALLFAALRTRRYTKTVSGFLVAERPVHVHDLQATILHCLGIDHRRLSFKFRGLDFRLTGVEEHHPVEELLEGRA